MKKMLLLALSVAVACQGPLSGSAFYGSLEHEGSPSLPDAIPTVTISLGDASRTSVNRKTIAGTIAGAIGSWAAGYFLGGTNGQSTVVGLLGAAAVGYLSRYVATQHTGEKTVEALSKNAINECNDALMRQESERAWYSLGNLSFGNPDEAQDRKTVYQELNKSPLAACNVVSHGSSALKTQNEKIVQCSQDATSKALKREEALREHEACLSESDKEMLRDREERLASTIEALRVVRSKNQALVQTSDSWLRTVKNANEVRRESMEEKIAHLDRRIAREEQTLKNIIGDDIFAELVSLALRNSAPTRRYLKLNKARIMSWQNSYHALINERNKVFTEHLKMDHATDALFSEYAGKLEYKDPNKEITSLIGWLERLVWATTIIC